MGKRITKMARARANRRGILRTAETRADGCEVVTAFTSPFVLLVKIKPGRDNVSAAEYRAAQLGVFLQDVDDVPRAAGAFCGGIGGCGCELPAGGCDRCPNCRRKLKRARGETFAADWRRAHFPDAATMDSYLSYPFIIDRTRDCPTSVNGERGAFPFSDDGAYNGSDKPLPRPPAEYTAKIRSAARQRSNAAARQDFAPEMREALDTLRELNRYDVREQFGPAAGTQPNTIVPTVVVPATVRAYVAPPEAPPYVAPPVPATADPPGAPFPMTAGQYAKARRAAIRARTHEMSAGCVIGPRPRDSWGNREPFVAG